jgi:hypothetical protein
LCISDLPNSLGTKATALPAADNTQPALQAVATSAVPATTDKPAATWPLTTMLACAPSEARSSTHTVPSATVLTAATVNIEPAVNNATGTATDTTTGKADNALMSDIPRCEGACAKPAVGAAKPMDKHSALTKKLRFMVDLRVDLLNAARSSTKPA